mmetsp:Transcript_71710/g.159478  ORF Transcript_71710/g.159478 Transcript_71710/m.159478 type:complete len:216 (+) Transcript_71710:130-777(+)
MAPAGTFRLNPYPPSPSPLCPFKSKKRHISTQLSTYRLLVHPLLSLTVERRPSTCPVRTIKHDPCGHIYHPFLNAPPTWALPKVGTCSVQRGDALQLRRRTMWGKMEEMREKPATVLTHIPPNRGMFASRRTQMTTRQAVTPPRCKIGDRSRVLRFRQLQSLLVPAQDAPQVRQDVCRQDRMPLLVVMTIASIILGSAGVRVDHMPMRFRDAGKA